MSIKKFKITGIIHNPAHQVTGLLVMEISKMHMFQLVICSCPEISDKIPGCFMRKKVAQIPEEDPKQIEDYKDDREDADPVKSAYRNTGFHDARHR